MKDKSHSNKMRSDLNAHEGHLPPWVKHPSLVHEQAHECVLLDVHYPVYKKLKLHTDKGQRPARREGPS